jgi:hypothetical protein
MSNIPPGQALLWQQDPLFHDRRKIWAFCCSVPVLNLSLIRLMRGGKHIPYAAFLGEPVLVDGGLKCLDHLAGRVARGPTV